MTFKKKLFVYLFSIYYIFIIIIIIIFLGGGGYFNAISKIMWLCWTWR